MKTEFEVGDWVTITKSSTNWNSHSMDRLVGKTVKITSITNASNQLIKFDDCSWCAWIFEHGHFREATYEEISRATVGEPKSHQTFKAGDKVRLIANTSSSCNKVGDIGVCIGNAEDDEIKVDVPGTTNPGNWSKFSDLEHYVEKAQTLVAGNWYKVPKTGNYIVKYKNPSMCSEYITSDGKYVSSGGGCIYEGAKRVDLKEIQQYLPHGHVDRLDKQPATNPVTFQPQENIEPESKEDPLITEAKRRYPVGTKFRCAHLPTEKDAWGIIEKHHSFIVSSGGVYISTDGINACAAQSGWHGCLKATINGGSWAEVIKPSPPETPKQQGYDSETSTRTISSLGWGFVERPQTPQLKDPNKLKHQKPIMVKTKAKRTKSYSIQQF